MTEPANPCPVCGEEMSRDVQTLDFYIVTEEVEMCPNGCYMYENWYGSLRITVGDQEFYGQDESEEIDKAIRALKEERKG